MQGTFDTFLTSFDSFDRFDTSIHLPEHPISWIFMVFAGIWVSRNPQNRQKSGRKVGISPRGVRNDQK